MERSEWSMLKALADRQGKAREARQIKLGALGQKIEDEDKPKVVWNRRQARINGLNITQRSGEGHNRIRSGVRTGAPSLQTLVMIMQTKEDGTKTRMLIPRDRFEAPNAI